MLYRYLPFSTNNRRLFCVWLAVDWNRLVRATTDKRFAAFQEIGLVAQFFEYEDDSGHQLAQVMRILSPKSKYIDLDDWYMPVYDKKDDHKVTFAPSSLRFHVLVYVISLVFVLRSVVFESV